MALEQTRVAKQMLDNTQQRAKKRQEKLEKQSDAAFERLFAGTAKKMTQTDGFGEGTEEPEKAPQPLTKSTPSKKGRTKSPRGRKTRLDDKSDYYSIRIQYKHIKAIDKEVKNRKAAGESGVTRASVIMEALQSRYGI